MGWLYRHYKRTHGKVQEILCDLDHKPEIPIASKGRKRFNELVDAAQHKLLKLRKHI